MRFFFRFISFFILIGFAYGEFSALSLEKGLSLQQPSYGNRFIGLGHAGIAYVSGSGISFKNPSKLAFNKIASVEAQFNTSFVNLNTNSQSKTFSSSDLSNIGLVIKLGSWGALAGSYQQLFSATYNQTIIDSNLTRSEFLKTGQLFEVGIAYAFDFHPLWSIGIGLYSLSGKIEDHSRRQFNNPLLLIQNDTLSQFFKGTRLNLSSTFRSFDFNIALSGDIPLLFNRKEDLSFPEQRNNSNTTKTQSFQSPLQYTVGINWKLAKNKNFVLDLSVARWDKELTQSNQTLYPQLGFGYENSGNLNPFSPLYQRLLYRFGTGYQQIHNAKANVYRLTAGLGIPIQREGIFDFNTEIGLRQWKNSSNSSEQYLKLFFSFVGFSRIRN